MSEVDDQIARSRAMLQRMADERGTPSTREARVEQRRQRRGGTRVSGPALTIGVILMVLALVGLVIGVVGLLGFAVLMPAIVAGMIYFGTRSADRPVSLDRLVQSDIKVLPAQTERWLAAQRPQLPAPAVQLVDRIGRRLETLSPQLARVDNDAPEAQEVRKLVGEQLPAFVNDYARVPATLRGEERNGRTPDTELVDGLKLIEQEIGEMTQRLAASDLDQLSTRGRFLEMKYKDDGQG